MSEDNDSPSRQEESELEREIRAGRKFTLAEAIGRLGADLMKGASPVTRKRQAELLIEEYLSTHLRDNDGALIVVVLRFARQSDLPSETLEYPLEGLARLVENLLESDRRLRALVRAVDAEWGRMYLERPFFEIEGREPHPKDPYTVAGVRAALSDLLARLNGTAE